MERTRIYQLWNQFEDDFLAPRAKALAIEGTVTNLGELRSDWQCDAYAIRSRSGIFDVKGVIVTNEGTIRGSRTELWRQPMLTGLEPTQTALIVHEFTGDHLIRIGVEPGNLGYKLANGKNTRVLIDPAIKFSPSVKAGNVPELAELNKLTGLIKQWEEQAEDGELCYERVNRYGVLRVHNHHDMCPYLDTLGNAADRFAWISHDLMIDLRKRSLLSGSYASALSRLI